MGTSGLNSLYITFKRIFRFPTLSGTNSHSGVRNYVSATGTGTPSFPSLFPCREGNVVDLCYFFKA